MKIHVRMSMNKQWYFTVHARNGKVVASSADTFKRKGYAIRAAKRLIAGRGAAQVVVEA